MRARPASVAALRWHEGFPPAYVLRDEDDGHVAPRGKVLEGLLNLRHGCPCDGPSHGQDMATVSRQRGLFRASRGRALPRTAVDCEEVGLAGRVDVADTREEHARDGVLVRAPHSYSARPSAQLAPHAASRRRSRSSGGVSAHLVADDGDEAAPLHGHVGHGGVGGRRSRSSRSSRARRRGPQARTAQWRRGSGESGGVTARAPQVCLTELMTLLTVFWQV